MTTRTITIAPDYESEYEVRKQQEARCDSDIEIAAIGLSEDEMITVVRAAERQRLRDAVIEKARRFREAWRAWLTRESNANEPTVEHFLSQVSEQRIQLCDAVDALNALLECEAKENK